jgi:hypothetical protein
MNRCFNCGSESVARVMDLPFDRPGNTTVIIQGAPDEYDTYIAGIHEMLSTSLAVERA